MGVKISIETEFSQNQTALGLIGRVGENIARQILFDCSSVNADWSTASMICAIRRPGDDAPYPAELERVESSDVFALTLTGAEVAISGVVRFELRLLEGEEVLKSAIYTGVVESALTGVLDTPDAPIPDVLNRTEQALERLERELADYELMERIEVTEDTEAFIRTTEPDGTPLKLCAAYIRFTSPTFEENRRVYFNLGSTNATSVWSRDRLAYHLLKDVVNTAGTPTVVYCERVRGIWRNWSVSGVNTITMYSSIQTDADALRAIRIFAYNNTTNLIPTGSVIEIWGVRDDGQN